VPHGSRQPIAVAEGPDPGVRQAHHRLATVKRDQQAAGCDSWRRSGVGTALVASIAEPEAFRSGLDFSACSLLERAPTIDGAPDIAATLLVFFAIILFGGLLQALFGLLRLGSLIKFAPHPVNMAGFQNMAAVLLFLVQLGNVLGFLRSPRSR
jgi:MFS superfamily sulfate permease-like transporter